jgi:hypothetical protein
MIVKRKTMLSTITTALVIAMNATGDKPFTVGTRLRVIEVAIRTMKVTQSHDQSSANL